MRLTTNVEYALHVCVLLAAVPGRTLPAFRLAEFHTLPPAATAKVLQQLVAAGVVTGNPGRTGGYSLAGSPMEITVDAIVRAVGSPKPVFRCREIRRQGPCAGDHRAYSSRCVIARLMDDAEDAWWAVLRAETLHAVALRVGDQLDGGIRDRSSAWLQERTRQP